MNISLASVRIGDHPRLRGEYFVIFSSAIVTTGSPPLARGILSPDTHTQEPQRITPACAGNTEQRAIQARIYEGSPPLARGIRMFGKDKGNIVRITPACAGNTIRHSSEWNPDEDHPRLRGEYKYLKVCKFAIKGSPPLARGIQTSDCKSSIFPGITPACAGNTDQSRPTS